jgi:hypothetical protein
MDNPRVIQGDHGLLTPERKAEYFRRLTPEERHRIFEGHLEVILALRPDLARNRHETEPSGSVRVVRLPQR